MIMENKTAYYLFAPFGFGCYDSLYRAQAHFNELFENSSCEFALLVKSTDTKWELLNLFVDTPVFE